MPKVRPDGIIDTIIRARAVVIIDTIGTIETEAIRGGNVTTTVTNLPYSTATVDKDYLLLTVEVHGEEQGVDHTDEWLRSPWKGRENLHPSDGLMVIVTRKRRLAQTALEDVLVADQNYPQ